MPSYLLMSFQWAIGFFKLSLSGVCGHTGHGDGDKWECPLCNGVFVLFLWQVIVMQMHRHNMHDFQA